MKSVPYEHGGILHFPLYPWAQRINDDESLYDPFLTGIIISFPPLFIAFFRTTSFKIRSFIRFLGPLGASYPRFSFSGVYFRLMVYDGQEAPYFGRTCCS